MLDRCTHNGGSVVALVVSPGSVAIDVSDFGKRRPSGTHPNQSLEPTPKTGTPAAGAPVAPVLGVAHHKTLGFLIFIIEQYGRFAFIENCSSSHRLLGV